MSLDLSKVPESIRVETGAYIVKYEDANNITQEFWIQHTGAGWTIFRNCSLGSCLNKLGEWEFQPIPSSRDEAFFKRCRFETVLDAVLLIAEIKNKK